MSAPGPTLRVLSYNVALGKALVRDRGVLERAFGREERLRAPDILAVQEVAGHEGGWQLDALSRLVGGEHRAFGLSDPIGPGYGHCERGAAIFSRHPMLARGVIQLPELREPRSAVWADLRAGGRLLRVYDVHLENRPRGGARGRAEQLTVVMSHARAWMREHPEAPLFVLGDFNTIFRREPCLELLREDFSPSLPARTSTHWTGRQLDWIFARNARLIRSEVIGLRFSDHRPVVADYALA